MSEEAGSKMTIERIMGLLAQSSPWLRERIGKECGCGSCLLCAHNLLSALAAVGNPEGLPEFLRKFYEFHTTGSTMDLHEAFDTLQIDPEKLP